MVDRMRDWWRDKGAWVIGAVLMACMLGIGWSASTMYMQAAHNRDIAAMSAAYAVALSARDDRYAALTKRAMATSAKATHVASTVTVAPSCVPDPNPQLKRWTQ